MSSEDDMEFVFRGSLIDGPDVDLVALSGLPLTEEQVEILWSTTSPRQLILDYLLCAETDIDVFDSAPGMSDTYFEYSCGKKSEFVMALRAAIADLLQVRE